MADEELNVDEGCGCEPESAEPIDGTGQEQSCEEPECPEDMESPPQAGQ